MASMDIGKNGEVDYRHFINKLGKLEMRLRESMESPNGYGAPVGDGVSDDEEGARGGAEATNGEIELAEVKQGESEDIRQTEDPTSRRSSLWGLTDSRSEVLYMYGRADSHESISSLTLSSNGEPESSTVDESVNIATMKQRKARRSTFLGTNFSGHEEMMMMHEAIEHIICALRDGEVVPSIFDVVQVCGIHLHGSILEKQHQASVQTMEELPWGPKIRELHFDDGGKAASQNILKASGHGAMMEICESETFAEDIDMRVLPDLVSVVAKSSQAHFENALLNCVQGVWIVEDESYGFDASTSPKKERFWRKWRTEHERAQFGDDGSDVSADGESSDEESEAEEQRQRKRIPRIMLDKSGGIGKLPQLIMGPVKRADRIRAKVEEYMLENDQSKVPYTQFISDVLRATIVCSSARDIVRAYENIRDFDAFEIVRLKNKMKKNKAPYNLHVNFLYKSEACAVPILCEVQIFSKDVYDMQHRQHIAYELVRIKTIEQLL
jgi:hypothetical protein